MTATCGVVEWSIMREQPVLFLLVVKIGRDFVTAIWEIFGIAVTDFPCGQSRGGGKFGEEFGFASVPLNFRVRGGPSISGLKIWKRLKGLRKFSGKICDRRFWEGGNWE